MRHNMGKTEKYVRLILGIALIAFGILYMGGISVFGGMVTTASIAGVVVGVVGVVFFITGVLSYCPLNALFHVNSCHACKIGETHTHLPI